MDEPEQAAEAAAPAEADHEEDPPHVQVFRCFSPFLSAMNVLTGFVSDKEAPLNVCAIPVPTFVMIILTIGIWNALEWDLVIATNTVWY
jgi:hypothetical protein